MRWFQVKRLGCRRAFESFAFNLPHLVYPFTFFIQALFGVGAAHLMGVWGYARGYGGVSPGVWSSAFGCAFQYGFEVGDVAAPG